MTPDPDTTKFGRVNCGPGDPIPRFDGILLRRRHSGMFDEFELAHGCLEFLQWANDSFNADGCPRGAVKDFSMDHAGPSPASACTMCALLRLR
jgi:hypothetical protein